MTNLIGQDIFDSVRDFHQQRDGVGELEAANVDEMLERIRDAMY